MNVYLATTLFALLIIVYWVIAEVFTLLFRLIGLPREKASFQVISLLTACGFTTKESEMVLTTRPRRRLARITMLFGYVFNLTIVTAFINVFVSMDGSATKSRITSLMIPIVAIIAVAVATKYTHAGHFMDRWLEKLAQRVSGSKGDNSVILIGQIGKDCIAQITLNKVPEFLDGKTLAESQMRTRYDILAMLVERKGQKAETPEGKTTFSVGEKITVFGEYKTILSVFNAKEYFADEEES